MTRHPTSLLSFVPAAGLLMLLGCATPAAPRGRLATDIDSACGGPVWRHRQALAADLTISREGRPAVRGSLLYDTCRDRLVIEFPSPSGGVTTVGFDGSTLRADGPDASQFYEWAEILQWVRWVSVPYRLTDSAYRIREAEPIFVAGRSYRIAEIQRPADGPILCALFIDRRTLRPRAAFPVLPADLPADTVASAYGLAYERFSVCDDVAVPIRWSVWDWNAYSGIATHHPVAIVKLGHLHFVEPDPAQFSPPPRPGP